MKRLSVYVVILLVVLIAAGPAASANSSGNPRVLPPNARVYGLTRAQWSAIFFQSIFAIPAPENPGVGAPWTKCYVDSIDRAGMGLAFFLPSGTFTCEMPRGMTLIQPVIGSECSTLEAPPFYGGTPEELRACAQSAVPANVQVTIDGFDVPNIEDYLSTSPLYYFTVPDDNIFGVPAGSAWSVAHMTTIAIAPLGVGPHTMHIHGEIPSVGFVYDWTYYMTVTP